MYLVEELVMNIIDPNETADVIYCIDVLACIFIMHFFGNDCLRSYFLKLLVHT